MRAKIIKWTNLFLRFRIFWFAKILSNVRLKKGNFHIVSPTLFLCYEGGQIGIWEGVHLGYYPSPYFFSGYNHFQVWGVGRYDTRSYIY
ncbi:hypothetical protein [Helicobacter sp.]|uniref:hypothetical protein n=1 Tax=Helicobacter sp. TaxID=218 RepID=UPI002A75415B|nr:hypothetical protein [Helicobacter sp.]MCI5969160.1 hypothetical protein [Helicobacter sp.]